MSVKSQQNGGIVDALTMLVNTTPLAQAGAGASLAAAALNVGEGLGEFEAFVDVSVLTLGSAREAHLQIIGGDASTVGASGPFQTLASVLLGASDSPSGAVSPTSAVGRYRIVFRNEFAGNVYGWITLRILGVATGVACTVAKCWITKRVD